MDNTDIKILSILEKNARISMKELAELVMLTPPATKERVTKLEEKGVITGYTANISLVALGRIMTAFILFETHDCKAFYDFCVKQPDVLECHRLAGQFSYLVKISSVSMEALELFIDDAIKYGKSSTHLIFSSTEKAIF
ncbi:Lrp/AsnC family transcriptional regulator [Listeria booriae]|uniref:Lrp/AsnC family transcriptional regulator n=1 Tax=Listeria booriae TaxID=1552123 RepID=A0A841YQV3_9LIST|nr:Lrp/AsnC family transcriptional regulator [Listeria booriae]MBC1402187.1 Lrp/AsnC family transcriptional regulator [Listeria booriae]MBC1617284.1 Lrp/AsnC family transcriptional regulator [Listeria booriae]